MGWATVNWPPENGNTLKPRPKLRKRLVKPMLIMLLALSIIMAALVYASWKYSNASLPYPAKYVQQPMVDNMNQNVLNKLMTIFRESKGNVSPSTAGLSETTSDSAPVIISDEIPEPYKNHSFEGVSRGGDYIRYKEVRDMVATAYTHTGNPTASGQWPRVGVVAVDTRIIPMGTRLYVDGYGYATALDRGGDIVGDRIDVFMDTEEEALIWGVKKVAVYILD